VILSHIFYRINILFFLTAYALQASLLLTTKNTKIYTKNTNFNLFIINSL